MPDLKTISEKKKKQLKWDNYLLKIEVLNIYYVPQMFSPNMLGLNI